MTAVSAAGSGPAASGLSAWRALLRTGWVLVVLWLVYAAQWVLPVINGWGIRPRSMEAPQGLVVGHMLHGNGLHLINNSWALGIFLWLLLLWSPRLTVRATIIIAVVCSLVTWTFGARGSMHIGASGIIFGYFALIVANGLLRRSVGWLLVALLVCLVYGGAMLAGMAWAQTGISWIMHASGLLGGLWAAWLLRRSPRRLAS